MLPELVVRIGTMFANGKDRINGQFFPAQRQRLGDRFEGWDVVLFGNRFRHVAHGILVDVKRDDVDTWVGQYTVKVVMLEKVLKNYMGMRPVREMRDDRSYFYSWASRRLRR